MPPHAFVQKPIRWLRAISRYKATHSGSPNFGYELCVAKISSDEASRLDLSSWRIAANGSEPIRPATLHAFQERFASSGFRPSAFHPCYGLAEATLKVTIGTADRLRDRFLDADALERGQVLEVSAEAPRARAIASSGSPSRHVELAIVDPESCEELSEGQIGEIWVAGRSVTAGYYNNEKASAETFSGRLVTSNRGPFLRTGDLGFTKEGELYVTGRRKDLIILAGRNLYPQDIERTVEDAHELLGTGCAVAFAVDDGRQEQLVVLFELARPRSDSGWTPLNVIDTVFRAIRRDHLVDASAIAAVPRGALLRTTSGKIRRRACRQAWSSGGLDLLERVPAGGASS
jgi:acyl-CoA synthetase (AMP-forming)/AMP-acid ligase II